MTEKRDLNKDINWLKNRINDKLNFGIFGPSDDAEIGYEKAMKEVLELIDELDGQQELPPPMPDFSEKAKKKRLKEKREVEKIIEELKKGSRKGSRYERFMEELRKVARYE